jgi:hypothetical protein
MKLLGSGVSLAVAYAPSTHPNSGPAAAIICAGLPGSAARPRAMRLKGRWRRKPRSMSGGVSTLPASSKSPLRTSGKGSGSGTLRVL